MQSYLNQPVASTIREDRVRAARGRGVRAALSHPPPGVRSSAAGLVARVARRLDAEAARRVTAA